MSILMNHKISLPLYVCIMRICGYCRNDSIYQPNAGIVDEQKKEVQRDSLLCVYFYEAKCFF